MSKKASSRPFLQQVFNGGYPGQTLTKNRDSIITYRHSAEKHFKKPDRVAAKVTD